MFPRNPIFSFWLYILLSLILAATFFYMDRLLPLGFAGGVPYISLVLV